MARSLRFSIRALTALAVFFFVLTARVVIASRSELAKGDALAASGNVDAAIAHYRRAARWYAPLSPYSTEALEELARIGRWSEQKGDTERALSAWRSVRAAILATRSTYVPHEERLELADRRIAALMAAGDPPPIDSELTAVERERAHFALLEKRPGPRVGFGLAAVAGFFVWVFAAFAFSHRAIDVDDRLVRPVAVRWALVWAGGFALFCCGLALA
ncbi:MAG: hypothetical protein H5U40_09010 [Polyangiaceae bacterium]|nr:hypothetical protein [Polyangiaceae bacterium]